MIKSKKIKIFICCFLLFFIGLGLVCFFLVKPAEKKVEKKLQVLFLGNSYTYFNDLPELVIKLSNADKNKKVKLHIRRYAKGGYSFKHHWEDAVSRKIINNRKWDIIVLQGWSLGAVFGQNVLKEYGQKWIQEIKKTKATPLLFLTWARLHLPEMIEVIAVNYQELAEKENINLCPVGRAWQLSLKERPELRLHQKDNSHPNSNGTYLSACVFYAYLTKSSPVGLIVPDLSISEKEVQFLQQIAWRTYKKYKDKAILQKIDENLLKKTRELNSKIRSEFREKR